MKSATKGLILVCAVCLLALTAHATTLSVNNTAAMVGSFGLEVALDTTSNPQAYVIDTTPDNEGSYRARFWLDPATAQIPINGAHVIFVGRDDDLASNNAILRVFLKRRTSTHRVRAIARQNTGTWARTQWVTIGNTAREIEVIYNEGTNNSDGLVSIERLDNGQTKTNNGDLLGRNIDEIRLGAVTSIDPGSTGSYYFDEFQSFR